jgi:two-component system, cell cycle sensor histidine kinase and response regulator CckA
MEKILRQISPQTFLAAIFVLSISLFGAVSLVPSLFYHRFDTPSYLVFHNCAEFFGVVVCLSIFGVGWYAFNRSKDRHALFLSTMFLGIGLMGFMHTLSFPGMPQFVTPNSTNKGIQFWLAFRLCYAGVFLASAYVYPDTGNRWLTKTNLLLFSLAVSILVFIGVEANGWNEYILMIERL